MYKIERNASFTCPDMYWFGYRIIAYGIFEYTVSWNASLPKISDLIEIGTESWLYYKV